jgi:hypothetical protein
VQAPGATLRAKMTLKPHVRHQWITYYAHNQRIQGCSEIKKQTHWWRCHHILFIYFSLWCIIVIYFMICPGCNAVISLTANKTCLPCPGTTKEDQKDHHLPCMMVVLYLMKVMIMTYTNKISTLIFDRNDDYDIQIKISSSFYTFSTLWWSPCLKQSLINTTNNQHILKVQENRVKSYVLVAWWFVWTLLDIPN